MSTVNSTASILDYIQNLEPDKKGVAMQLFSD